jgi:hypothetical protein
MPKGQSQQPAQETDRLTGKVEHEDIANTGGAL